MGYMPQGRGNPEKADNKSAITYYSMFECSLRKRVKSVTGWKW